MRNISVKYFEFGPVVQEKMSFKDISYLPFFICAILVEGIMRNISVKLFSIWTGGSGENVV